METVKIYITIDIQAEGEIDTEMTVDQWNALTDAQRDGIYQSNWEAMAEGGGGGVEVLTEGAEPL